uniref:Uncharacterized protein n=1 Tax=Chromera velia CCMP2878 TaxID=1169474 RepID=A0A0G4ID36_9ALVE|eukprot:Cvel_118.t1-p1 / transcript=Cvel_118.t1 / gene=Cvel_118 / organism=Chromera_velia_CCMP2878 / gene_product=hypothetical protein / transcript_product=hypothetical protein / location=Cvel_scaffold8:214142-218298(+) / protein_length=237 / sequence_SO=supercontig / SO=protein_coding / is_pseudo=false
MIPMGGGGGMGMGSLAVTPSQTAQTFARWLMIFLGASFCYAIALCVVSFAKFWLWALLQIIAGLFAWCAIRDPQAYKPMMLNMSSLLSTFNSAFLAIYVCIAVYILTPWGWREQEKAIQQLIDRGATGIKMPSYGSALFVTIVMGTALPVIVTCIVLSWKLFKECLFCSPAQEMDPLGPQGGGGGGGMFGGPAGGGGQQQQGGYDQEAGGPSGGQPSSQAPQGPSFQPFQGQGHRLG